jgi:hypothetical protein
MLLVLVCATCAFADASLYLYPRADIKAGGIAYSDIAIIDADSETAVRIGATPVDAGLLADGFLDESEIRRALEGLIDGRLRIYGTGVRVAAAGKNAAAERSTAAVRTGARVRFLVVRSGVRVEMTGTALREGSVGDVIPVKLKGTAVSSGTIINDSIVELKL